MKSNLREIHGRPAPKSPATTEVRSGHTHPPFENEDTEIPQDSPSSKKRTMPEDSKKSSPKRSNILHDGSSQETSSNQIPSDIATLTKDETSTVLNPPQVLQEPTTARLTRHLDTNDASMAVYPISPPPPISDGYIPFPTAFLRADCHLLNSTIRIMNSSKESDNSNNSWRDNLPNNASIKMLEIKKRDYKSWLGIPFSQSYLNYTLPGQASTAPSHTKTVNAKNLTMLLSDQ